MKKDNIPEIIIQKKAELKEQSDIVVNRKPDNITDRMDKIKSLDPRQSALEGFDPIKETMDLLKIAFDTCKDSKNVSDIVKLLNSVVRIKESFFNDPEHLMKQIMKMDDDQKAIFVSLLERDRLLTGFKKRKLDSKKIFGI